MGHNAETGGQNGGHHGHVGAVPEQPPVFNLLVDGEALRLGVTVELEDVNDLEFAITLGLGHVSLNDVVHLGALGNGGEVAVECAVALVQRVLHLSAHFNLVSLLHLVLKRLRDLNVSEHL